MKPIFVHIPKTAGTYIRSVLPNVNHDVHTRASVLISKYGSESCFTFTFTRNPWDRFVSAYFYLTGGVGNGGDNKLGEAILSKGSFREFVLFLGSSKFANTFLNRLHFLPQSHWLDQGIDFIGKFESLEKDLDIICDILYVPEREKSSQFNLSKRAHYSHYYDDETREIIGNIYSKDIDLWNYSFHKKLQIPNTNTSDFISKSIGQMSPREYEYIASIALDKKMLVFGTGNDTPLWQKISKYSVFLENDEKWIPKENSQNVYLVAYTCKIEDYKTYFDSLKNGDDSSLLIDLPNKIKVKWDVILVDAPTGYSTGQHGRMQSIYAAYLLADKDTDIFIHDYDRDVEKTYSDYLFKTKIEHFHRLAHFKK
jgi:uncharacterized protein (TIGR01627 family)